MTRDEVDVVVVGAGPGGLAAGVTLGSYGIETLVVERRTQASTLPRATVASTGTMELMRRWGLEDETWDRSIDVDWRAWACPTLAAADLGRAVEVGLPTRAQAALVSPTAPACIPQDELEPILERRLASLPSVTLERGVELVGLERADDGTWRLALAGPDGRRQVRARYLIGADGLRSRVRAALGIAADGDDQLGQRLAAVLHAPLWELVGEHRHGIYFLDGDRSFLPAGKPDRWQFGLPWKDGLELPAPGRARAVDSRGSRRPRAAGRDRAAAAGHLRDRARRALPRRQRVPHRRRGAPGDPARRHRAQHGDPRRLRRRLEARLGSARLGGRAAARQLRARAAARRRVQRGALVACRRLPPRHRRRAERRHRRPDPARVGAARRRARLVARPARRRPHPVRRPAVERRSVRPAARRGAGAGRAARRRSRLAASLSPRPVRCSSGPTGSRWALSNEDAALGIELAGWTPELARAV